MQRREVVLAASLVALTALIVGFQAASTLLTVTQIGASPVKGPPPKAHSSLVPQPSQPAVKPSEPVSAKPSEPASMPALAVRASEPAADKSAPVPVSAETTPVPSVPDNQVGVAAAAKSQAQAEMDTMGDQVERPAPQPERRRRYRAPRPELHKVY